MSALAEDVRFAFRSLCKSPVGSAAILMTLAIGIGASAAVFGIMSATVLSSLPFPNSDRLTSIYQINVQTGRKAWTSITDFLQFKEGASSLAHVAGYQEKNFTLGDKVVAIPVPGALATSDFFPTVGLPLLKGRSFRDDDADGTIVISESLWRSFFRGDVNVVGRSVLLDGRSATIVGVAPTRMWFPSSKCQLWRLITMDYPLFEKNTNYRFLHLLGRAKPEASFAQMQSELAMVSQGLARTEPELNSHMGVLAIPLFGDLFEALRPLFKIATLTVSIVLLIVVANTANLQFSRSLRRQGEVEMRLILGASRWRILRLFLVENMLIAVGGGISSLLVAFLGVTLTLKLNPLPVPVSSWVSISPRVLLLEAVLCVVIGLSLAVVSSVQVLFLKHVGAGSSTRTVSHARGIRIYHSVLIASETAATLTLLIAVVLMVQSYIRLSSIDVGFQTKRLLTLTFRLPEEAYPNQASLLMIQQRLRDRISTIAGVVSVGASSDVPLVGYFQNYFSIEGEGPVSASERQFVIQSSVSPGYFATMQIPIVSGREFTPSDREGSQLVAIINESMRRTYFPDRDPIGQNIRHGLPDEPTRWYTIVGVVRDTRPLVTTMPSPRLFTPFMQIPRDYEEILARPLTLEVRSSTDNMIALNSALRAVIQDLDPTLGYDIRSTSDVVDESFSRPRFHAALFCFFGGIAFWLSVIGIYGVTSNRIEQETRALGIRLALGATRSSIARSVLLRGAVMSGIGVVIGSWTSLYLMRILHSLLFGIVSLNPLVPLGTAFALQAASLLAVYGPARAASKIEPAVALRQE